MSEATDDARLLIEALGQAWAGITDLLGAGRDEFETALLAPLRALDAALAADEADDPVRAAQAAVLAVLRTRPDAAQHVVAAVDELVRNAERGGPSPIPGAVVQLRYLEVPVLFRTDRAAGGGPGEWFGGERGEPAYGVAWVSIPDDHRMAALEKPRWWRLQFRSDPAQHVTVLRTETLSRPRFVTRAADTLTPAAGGEALMFIHGYNVTFADAARRAAQIVYDLNFPGLPLLYSWPSEGATLRYTVDENNARWATPHLRDHLHLALTDIGATRVHVLAHSMGNRLLADALTQLDAPAATRLGQIVFAAPDVDAAVFTQLANLFTATIASQARRTLYASSKDKALHASQLLAKYPRAGQSGPDIVVVSGIDTIDASDLDTGLMSHSYFGDRTSILGDLFHLLRGRTPEDRFGLSAQTSPTGLPYWIFTPRLA